MYSHINANCAVSNYRTTSFEAQRQTFSAKYSNLRGESNCLITEEAASKIEQMKRHSVIFQKYPRSKEVLSGFATYTVVGSFSMDIYIDYTRTTMLDVPFLIVKSMFYCEITDCYDEFGDDFEAVLPFNI